MILSYVNFQGNCRQAVEFYSEVFGTEKAKFMTFGEMPPDPEFVMPEEAKNLVAHTQLMINETMVMFSDTPPGMPFVQGNNITLIVVSEDMDEIKTLYNKLKVGGKVDMEPGETFWSKAYGSVIDKFGVGWQFNYGNGDMNM